MTKLEKDPVSQDLSDIEMGHFKRRCFHCRERQLKVAKILITVDGLGNENASTGKTEMGVCTNPKCFRYTRPENIPSWKVIG